MAKVSSQLLVLLTASLVACLPQFLQEPDYKEVLRLSLLFYEAQRSGHLPETNRIRWRGDSALKDSGQRGEDLTGGYYDASDFVKFSFTMAFTTTLMAWGVLSYEDGYREAEQYKQALEAIRWASDYFIKCHVSPLEFYGQVGDFAIDHKYWGRPEEMNMSRPAYKIDVDHPGSDLAGEASAALAATALVFRDIDQKYYQLTLKHAEELYRFAVTYRGLYHEAIPGVKAYYQSSGYGDELTWAAVWLYKATNNKTYIENAENLYKTHKLHEKSSEFFYNKKVIGLQVLLAEETGKPEYRESVREFCDHAIGKQKRTPKGLVYIEKVGTLSHAANVAFICLQAAGMNISTPTYVNFARQQIDYMLGSAGRSFLVGYGKSYPTKPHHSASSCPDLPALCGWDAYESKNANPQTLYGALVSGPDQNDHYEDRRDEFLYNEVTLDYNAGFQGVIAGLIHYHNNYTDNNNDDSES